MLALLCFLVHLCSTFRLSRIGLRLSDTPAPTRSTLNEEGERIRWFYLPSENPVFPDPSKLQPAPSIIKPKFYKWEQAESTKKAMMAKHETPRY